MTTAVLIGCGGSESTGGGTSSSPDGPLAARQIVRTPFADDPVPLDPATLFRTSTEELAFNIYSALTTYDVDGKIAPDLAERWESPDPATFIFKLRSGVKWQKGYGELTSEDILYSFRRVLDPATGSPYANDFATVDSYSAPDERTVQIKLKGPDVNFLHQVASYHQGQIVQKKAIEELGKEYGFKPVGTGAFMLDSFTPGQEIVLSRNPDYFRGPATLEKVHFRFIKDPETQAIAFQNSEIDILGGTSNPETLKRLEADSRVALNPNSGQNIGVQIFNTENQFLKDLRVRKAYIHAVDRAAILLNTSPINGRVWHNIVPEWMDIYNPNVATFEYSEAKAKELLSAAGYGTSGITLRWPTQSVSDEQQLYQAYLAKVGIKLDFVIMDTPTYNGVRNRGEFDVATRSLPAVNPDTILFGYLHPSNFPPRGFNGARYNNPQVTRLLESARAELDFEKRKSMYFEVQEIAMEEAAYMARSHNKGMTIAFEWISGLKPNALTNLNFYDVKVHQS